MKQKAQWDRITEVRHTNHEKIELFDFALVLVLTPSHLDFMFSTIYS